MRFEPIKTLPKQGATINEDACNALIEKLDVFAWHWQEPQRASELERFLKYGKSNKRQSDFFDIHTEQYSSGYNKLARFDHAISFKAHTCGIPFVLTMPYGNEESFYKNFNAFVNAYYQQKAYLVDTKFPAHSPYASKSWQRELNPGARQIRVNGKIEIVYPSKERCMTAAVISDKFKIRKNGDFVAVIAAPGSMSVIREFLGVTSDSETYND